MRILYDTSQKIKRTDLEKFTFKRPIHAILYHFILQFLSKTSFFGNNLTVVSDIASENFCDKSDKTVADVF